MQTGRQQKSLKLLLIGLDGATFDIINPMLADGELPTLAGLISGGCSGLLESTIPPFSAPAWSSFMTGMNPGRHGIFSFTNYNPLSYTQMESNFVSSKTLAGNTIFDIMSQAGLRLGVISIPITYPVWPINGFMVAGEPCPDTNRYLAYPQDFENSLTRRYAFSSTTWSLSNDEIIKRLYQMDEDRVKLAVQLINEQNVDVMILVLGATDRAQHNFWRFYDAEYGARLGLPDQPQYRQTIQETYRRADALVAELLQNTTEDTQVLVISDHGGGPAAFWHLNTNAWLKQGGFLAVKENQDNLISHFYEPIKSIKRILDTPGGQTLRKLIPSQVIGKGRMYIRNIAQLNWASTRAYRFQMYPPAEGIVINMIGRQENGIVSTGQEYEQLRTEIITSALRIKNPDTGEPVVIHAYRREEIYTGSYLEKAPDIIFILADNYCGGNELEDIITRTDPATLSKVNGEHRMHGILIAKGPTIKSGEVISGARLMDIPATLLRSLGLTVAGEMDGIVLETLYKPGYATSNKDFINMHSWSVDSEGEESELTPDEEEQIRTQLQRLGYL